MHLGPHIEQPGGGTGGAGGSFSAGVSTLGNTLGSTGTVSNQVVLAGGANVTLSQSTNAGGATITVIGAAGAGATAISGLGNSETTYTSGTVALSGLGNVTVRSTTGQAFQISVPAQSVQAETQTFVSGIANSQTTYTSGNITLSELANITIRSTTGQQFQFSVPSGATATGNLNAISNSNTTYTSGTIGLSELGAITIRSTTGNQFQFSVNSQSVQAETQTFIAGIQNSETTYTSGSVKLSVVGGNMTIRSTTGQAFQFSVSQSVQAETQTAISGIANSQTTYTSGTVSWSELGAVTIRSTTGNQFQISVNSQTNQSAIRGFGASNTGNTAGNTGISTGIDWVLAGSTNITVSQSTAVGGPNTLWLSAPNAGAGQFSGGMSNLGNTAGSSGITGTQLVLVGTNMISLSQSTGANGGTLSINATQSVQTQNLHNLSFSTTAGGGTAGTMAEISSGTVTMYAGNNITISQSATNKVVISALASSSLSATGRVSISTNASTISIGVPYDAEHIFENFPMAQAQLLTHISGISKIPFYWNEQLEGSINPKSIVLRMSNVATATLQAFSIHFGVYTMVNSTSAALLGSASNAFDVSTASSASWSGQRNFILTSPGTVAAISNLTPGDYIFGLMFSGTATGAMHQSLYGASNAAFGALGGIYPGVNQASTGTSQGIYALHGRGSTTVNVMPANVVASELVNQGSGASAQLRPWIFMRS